MATRRRKPVRKPRARATRRRPATPKRHPRQLRRFLKPGETLRVLGLKGKPITRARAGRNYVVEVRKGGKVVDYVNPIKNGKPVPRSFTTSMLSRLKYTRNQPYLSAPQAGKTYRLTSKRHLKAQITPRMLAEIRRHKGKAFSFRIQIGRDSLHTHSIYFKGRMSDDALRNLIVSDLLYTLSRKNFRISPKPQSITDQSKIKRVKTAQLTFQYSEVAKPKGVRRYVKKRNQKRHEKIRGRKNRKARR